MRIGPIRLVLMVGPQQRVVGLSRRLIGLHDAGVIDEHV